jgi:hypothetical protein
VLLTQAEARQKRLWSNATSRDLITRSKRGEPAD